MMNPSRSDSPLAAARNFSKAPNARAAGMRFAHSGMGGGAGMAAQAASSGNCTDDFRRGQVDRRDHRAHHIAKIREQIAATPRLPLTDAEQHDLLYMREEEKIARDVYLALYERWDIRPFGNISGAEQAHMDAILALLQHHHLPDPAQGLEVGRFHQPAFQQLHDELVQRGSQSREEAVRVGLLVEELDIADLQQAARRTNKPEILAVYAELERGSRNHLRAFYRWKQMLGIDYPPAHLPAEEFERIARSAHEDCE